MIMTNVSFASADELLRHPGFLPMVEEYAQESATRGMPKPNFAKEMYIGMESMGILKCIQAVDGEKLIGFMVLIATVIPHYSRVAVTTESLFVIEEYRKTGAGLRMIRLAETFGRSIGAAGIFLSAPEGGKLAAVAPRIGYQHASNVFFKGLL